MSSGSLGPANSYLSDYGVTDAKREKRFKRIVAAVIATALLSVSLWFYFRTFFEEREVKRFFAYLADKNYKAAHAQFGCTDATPCRDYGFEKFLEDWGDKSQFADVSGVKFTLAEPCGNTVWVAVKHPRQSSELGLAVDRETHTITYTPEARCPGVWRFREFPEKLWAFLRRRV